MNQFQSFLFVSLFGFGIVAVAAYCAAIYWERRCLKAEERLQQWKAWGTGYDNIIRDLNATIKEQLETIHRHSMGFPLTILPSISDEEIDRIRKDFEESYKGKNTGLITLPQSYAQWGYVPEEFTFCGQKDSVVSKETQ